MDIFPRRVIITRREEENPIMARIDHFFDERFVIDFLCKVPQLGLVPSRIAGCEIIPLKTRESKKKGVFSFRLSVRGSGNVPTTPVSIIAKYRQSAKDKATFEIMRQLWEKGFGGESHLRISQPIAYIEDWRILLSYRANGLTLEQILEAGHKSAASCIAQAAQWLALLHQTVVISPKIRSVQDEADKMAERFEATMKKFKKKHPSLTSRAERVAGEIVQRVRSVDPSSFKLTHGDFLPKNVLSDGSDLTVIDLGRIGLFDPAKDVGKFIGHFVVKTRQYAPGVDPEALRELFLRTYAQKYSGEFSERIAAYEARSYLRRPPKENAPESAMYWLQRAEDCLKGVRREGSSGSQPQALEVARTLPREK